MSAGKRSGPAGEQGRRQLTYDGIIQGPGDARSDALDREASEHFPLETILTARYLLERWWGRE
jgi:hypothetical protein